MENKLKCWKLIIYVDKQKVQNKNIFIIYKLFKLFCNCLSIKGFHLCYEIKNSNNDRILLNFNVFLFNWNDQKKIKIINNLSWNFISFSGFFLTSAAHGPFKAWAHGFNQTNHGVSTYPSARANAFSIRCTKDWRAAFNRNHNKWLWPWSVIMEKYLENNKKMSIFRQKI